MQKENSTRELNPFDSHRSFLARLTENFCVNWGRTIQPSILIPFLIVTKIES